MLKHYNPPRRGPPPPHLSSDQPTPLHSSQWHSGARVRMEATPAQSASRTQKRSSGCRARAVSVAMSLYWICSYTKCADQSVFVTHAAVRPDRTVVLEVRRNIARGIYEVDESDLPWMQPFPLAHSLVSDTRPWMWTVHCHSRVSLVGREVTTGGEYGSGTTTLFFFAIRPPEPVHTPRGG